MVSFEFVEGENRKSIDIGDTKFSVGRDIRAGYRTDDLRVSREHAHIFTRGGVVHVEDLGSTNGTTINGASVEPWKAHPLAPGDVVGFGEAIEARLESDG